MGHDELIYRAHLFLEEQGAIDEGLKELLVAKAPTLTRMAKKVAKGSPSGRALIHRQITKPMRGTALALRYLHKARKLLKTNPARAEVMYRRAVAVLKVRGSQVAGGGAGMAHFGGGFLSPASAPSFALGSAIADLISSLMRQRTQRKALQRSVEKAASTLRTVGVHLR